jgi:hypothetical protein
VTFAPSNSHVKPAWWRRVLFLRPWQHEALALLLLLFILVVCNVRLQGMTLVSSRQGLGPLILSWLIALGLAGFAYGVARIVLGAYGSAGTISAVILGLSMGHRIKASQTGEALSWPDLVGVHNASAWVAYLNGKHQVAIVLVLMMVAGALWVDRRINRGSSARRRVALTALLGLTCLGAHPVIAAASMAWMAGEVGPLRIKYRPWNTVENVRQNGLLLHLLQTAQSPLPRASDEAGQLFAALQERPDPARTRPRTLVLVECEACWHDDNWFHESFAPLRDVGFRELRAQSPGYGGQTVNTTFELLTGLPSRGVLSGVVFMEYGARMRDTTLAIPSQLRALGYRTVAVHNFKRRFWRRHLAA